MGITAYLKNQVKNHSKIENSVNNKKSKISKSNFSKSWKENIDKMLNIMIQTSSLLLFSVVIITVGTRVSNLSHFWSENNLFKFAETKKHFWISKDDIRIHPYVILQLRISSQRSLGISKTLSDI